LRYSPRKPDICVIDQRIRRMSKVIRVELPSPVLSVINRPSTISQQLLKALDRVTEIGHGTVLIHGEEDLALIPLVLRLPTRSIACYGDPFGNALVAVIVTDVVKRAFGRALNKMVRVKMS